MLFLILLLLDATLTQLLLGESPWNCQYGPDINLTMIKILLKRGEMFPIPHKINKDLFELLSQTLDILPENRISAKQCLLSKFL